MVLPDLVTKINGDIFPSVGLAWRISDESWFYNNVGSSSDNLLGSLIEKLEPNISDLKLKLKVMGKQVIKVFHLRLFQYLVFQML